MLLERQAKPLAAPMGRKRVGFGEQHAESVGSESRERVGLAQGERNTSATSIKAWSPASRP
jgi:hypothetical protein